MEKPFLAAAPPAQDKEAGGRQGRLAIAVADSGHRFAWLYAMAVANKGLHFACRYAIAVADSGHHFAWPPYRTGVKRYE